MVRQQPPPAFRPPPPPAPPPRRRFPWTTFWTAVGSLATAGGIIAAVAVNDRAAQPEVTPNASRVASVPAPATTTPTASETADLAARVDQAVLHPCSPRPDLEGSDGIGSAVECAPVAAGPTTNPLVLRYEGADALAGAVRAETRAAGTATAASCGDGDASHVGSWRDGAGDVRGDLVCRYDTDAAAYRIVWTFTDDDVLLVANGETHDLYQWWQANADRVLTAGS